MTKRLTFPVSAAEIRNLHMGEAVLLSGILVTARDTAHKWLTETFLHPAASPSSADQEIYQTLRSILKGGALYHCGPVVGGLDTQNYRFVAAGPTTSSREEPYEADVIRHFELKAVIGKGGMGETTLQACKEAPAVYLHAIGGAAAWIAQTVRKVHGVYKLEFGVPEALWVIEVQDFPAVVTMDAHGNNLHEQVRSQSAAKINELFRTIS